MTRQLPRLSLEIFNFMKNFFSKRFKGIRNITWLTNVAEFLISSLTIFYFGRNNDLKEKGLPDWGVCCLIIFMFAIIAFKTCLEHYENKQEL